MRNPHWIILEIIHVNKFRQCIGVERDLYHQKYIFDLDDWYINMNERGMDILSERYPGQLVQLTIGCQVWVPREIANRIMIT